MKHLELLVLAVLPVLWVTGAGDAAFGPFSVDLAGHLWMGWHASQEGLTYTELLAAPDGVDLLPVLGGWLDVWLVGRLHALGAPLELAYNGVAGLYVLVAGLGGVVLARAAGARRSAVLAGLLLQCDGFVLEHLGAGRPEQVGIGFVALALGAAFLTLRGRLHPVLCGLAGVPLLFVSWELSLLTVLVLAWMLPFARPIPWKKLAMAAGTCALLAGPWVLFFLSHAGDVRALDEGDFALETARTASIGLLSWFAPGTVRPAWFALACIPLVLRGRVGLGVAGGLILNLILALGPGPGLFEPSDASWGPFAWLQKLPVLGWFHWPDRLLAVWSLAAAVCAALAVEKLPKLWMAVLAAVVVLSEGLVEQRERWPRGIFALQDHPGAQHLSRGEGIVLDLPIQPEPVNHLRYMLLQMEHGRPIVFNMVLDHLADPRLSERIDADPVLSWFRALMEPEKPDRSEFSAADFAGLRAQGVRDIVLHRRGWPPDRWQLASLVLERSLGEPAMRVGPEWTAWSLSATAPEGLPRPLDDDLVGPGELAPDGVGSPDPILEQDE